MRLSLIHKFQEWISKDIFKSFLIYLYVFFLPLSDWLSIKINSFIIIILSFIWLLERIKYGIRIEVKHLSSFFLLSGLFLIQIVSFFHGGSSEDMFSNLAIKLPFLIFPLTWPIFYKQVCFEKIKNAFIIGVLLACCCSFRFVFSSSYSFTDILNYTLYENYLVLHRPYFGIYLLVAISFLLHDFRNKGWSMLIIVFFLFFLFLIQAKTSWLILFFVFLIQVAMHPASRKRIFLMASLIILMIILFWGAALYYDNQQHNSNELSGLKRFYILSINTRMIHFECAWENIRLHLFSGAGSGNTTSLMNQCYNTFHPYIQQSGKYFNAHNEFLEEGMRHGLLGISTYACCFFFFFRKAICRLDKIYIQYLLIIVIASLTESIFSRSQGVLLVAFLNTFFYYRATHVQQNADVAVAQPDTN